MSGHLQPFDHATGLGAGADGAGGTGAVGLTVGAGAAVEAVALHDAGEAAALRGPRHVDELALLEYLAADLLADFPISDVVHAELAKVAELSQTLHVTLLR